jgi:serine/threonine-protein kinase RsbW
VTVFAGDHGAAGRKGRRGGLPASVVDSFALHLPAEPVTAAEVRKLLRAWLEGHRWPPDAVDDVVLAVHEAVANAIDHAYPAGHVGDVDVTANLLAEGRRQRTRLVVRDGGRWRAPPVDPGYRGRGLQMVRSCMDLVNILPGTGTRSGTEVTMLSASVPAAAPDRPVRAGVQERCRYRLRRLQNGVPVVLEYVATRARILTTRVRAALRRRAARRTRAANASIPARRSPRHAPYLRAS